MENEKGVVELKNGTPEVEILEPGSPKWKNLPSTFVKTEETWRDREEAWLDFNWRVMDQPMRSDIPVYARIPFIGISASNVSEFTSVRFADKDKDDAENPEHVEKLRNKIRSMNIRIQWMAEQYNEKYHLWETITNKDKDDLRKFFYKQIYPMLTPIAVGNNKEIPMLDDKDLNFFVKAHSKEQPDEKRYVFLQVSHEVNRFVEHKEKIYLMEDIISLFMNEIFNTCVVEDFIQFTVCKNYSEEIQKNNNVSVTERIEKVIKNRRKNNVVFMVVLRDKHRSSNIVKKLTKLLKVKKENVLDVVKTNPNIMIGAQIFTKYPKKIQDDNEYPNYNENFKPKWPEELIGEKSVLGYLEDSDLLVHHPYETYDVVLEFLREASQDSKVVSIKQTLYRVSSPNSPIVKYLCDAASNGVKVTVMLEVLARFDERQNISLIKHLKESGVNIVYSLDGLKTHCKMCLVVKAGKKGLQIFSHVGTGNYNEKSAKQYTDISYFTSRPEIGSELNALFNMISGISKPMDLKTVSYSPDTLRPTLLKEMDWVANAINKHDNQKFVKKIWMKFNSFSDEMMVQKIEELADAHPDVEFNIICRGICSMPEYRENIHIKSVIGRFLEHSRIYMFQVGGKYHTYISSADLLTRNLDRRVETLVRIDDSSSKKKLKNIMLTYWKDTANSWKFSYDRKTFEGLNVNIGCNWSLYWHGGNAYFNAQNEFTK